MPARKRRVPTKRHGTRNFLLAALETTRSGPAIATAAIIRQVRKLAGKRLPEETIRSSLKTLVRQRVVKGRKSGHEKVYKLATPNESGSEAPLPAAIFERRTSGSPIPRDEIDLAVHKGLLLGHLKAHAEEASFSPPIPPKLAVGDVLILHVGETHVETATNVHGRVVLERHARPR